MKLLTYLMIKSYGFIFLNYPITKNTGEMWDGTIKNFHYIENMRLSLKQICTKYKELLVRLLYF